MMFMVSFGRWLTRAGIGCCVELPLPTASQNQSWWCKHAVTWAGWLIVFFHTLRKPGRVCSPQEEVCCRRHFKFSKYVLNLDMDISMTVWCWSYASERKLSIYIHTMSKHFYRLPEFKLWCHISTSSTCLAEYLEQEVIFVVNQSLINY